jgi:N utilization substance protein B
VLYGIDSQTVGDDEIERAMLAYWTNLDGPLPGRAYCDQIVRGVLAQREAIDAAIRLANPAWRIERMARVDRNIIRIATWEMLHTTDVAPEVAMDEAIEIARKYGTEDSPAFVNGTIDKIASQHGRGRAARTP